MPVKLKEMTARTMRLIHDIGIAAEEHTTDLNGNDQMIVLISALTSIICRMEPHDRRMLESSLREGDEEINH